MREIRTSGSTRGGALHGPLLLYRPIMQAPGTFLFQTGNRAAGDSDVFDMYFFHLARGWHPT